MLYFVKLNYICAMKADVPYVNIHKHSDSEQGEIALKNLFLAEYYSIANDKIQNFSVGFHPWQTKVETHVAEVKKGLEIAAFSAQVVALGETGLDKAVSNPFEKQLQIFKAHIEVSETYRKPLIIHCVRAFQEVFTIRKELKASQTWIFHGFNGSAQLAMQIISSGCIVSFGNAILNEGTRATHSLLHLHPEHFFLETDDSAIAISTIYEMASRITQLSRHELAVRLYANFVRLFGKLNTTV